MKRLLMTLIVLSILLSSVVKPAKADYPQPYYSDLLTALQFSSPAGVEHYVFWKTYLYAMFTDDPYLDKPVKWWTTSNTILTQAINAHSQWNALRPAGVSATVQASSLGAADLIYKYQNCPTGNPLNKLGCRVVDSWVALGTLNVNAWYKTSLYIRPDSFVEPGTNPAVTQFYASGTLGAIVSHETGHALTGEADQIFGSWCNSSITTLMDGFYIDSSDVTAPIYHPVYPCDVYAPIDNGHDENAWVRYHTAGRYLPYTYVVYGDGKAAASWYDYAWNDYQMQATWWRCGASSSCTTSILFATTYHIGDNGSHYDVYDASGRRIVASAYPGATYNVHSQYIYVCTRPVYNYAVSVSSSEEHCMPPFYYGY